MKIKEVFETCRELKKKVVAWKKTKKLTIFWRKAKGIFCKVFFCRVNLRRDVIVILITVFISAIIVFVANYSVNITMQRRSAEEETRLLAKKTKNYLSGQELLSEEEVYQEVKSIQETIDKSNWKTYQNKWYGFEVGYPENWASPRGVAASTDSKWEYQFQFRRDVTLTEDVNLYAGFDVVVYDLDKINSLRGTEEFPVIKNDVDLKVDYECETIGGHIIETGDYAAEEIYIPPTDDCYVSTLFFSFTKGDYSYNITPVLREGFSFTGDPQVEISDNFPEFFAIASTLNPIDIVRPKPVPPKPKITAPYPVSYKVVGGKLVCAKKKDKPSKSDKHKGKHLDMECCLDPDEYPNPHCYYDPNKYGKYLGN